MVLIMEDFSKPSFNTLEEVKKLQDLVRKLEIQNQQLRNKQNKSTRKSSNSGHKENAKSPPPNILKSSEERADADPIIVGNGNNNISTAEESLSGSQNDNTSYFDEIEILKLSDVDLSDDDCWLYTSPRGLTPEQKRESPHVWLRKDVDDPRNKELQMAKKALITKLNELEILSPLNQRGVPVTNRLNYPANKPHANFNKPHVPYKFVSTTQEIHYSVLDTRTFTKSKKRQALQYLATTLPQETMIETTNIECELYRRGSDISLDSTGTYTLADANDVQEVARMQEESLRMNSPIGTPKRQQSGRRMSVSSKSSVSDIDNTEFPSLNSQCSFDEGSCQPITVTPTSIQVERPVHSDQSTPSQSPYGSNASLNGSDEKGDVYRRSLPNLNRSRSDARRISPSEKKKQKSFAAKAGAAGRRSDSNLLLAASSKTRRGATSPMRNPIKQPSNYSSVSPSAYGNKVKEPSSLPPRNVEAAPGRMPVKSGLPRPARATSATRVWSGIPKPSMATKKQNEDSWSDGCF